MNSITDVAYVGYGVKDFDAECTFYTDAWKLERLADHDGMAYFAAAGSTAHHVVRLRPCDENRIDVISFTAASSAAVDSLAEKVRQSTAKLISEPAAIDAPGGGYGFRFFSPDGLTFEIASGVETRSARALQRWDGVPEKVSHVVLHSPDHKALAEFFIDVLGFRLSDWLGDFMAFLRCNEWHHRIAILPGPPCLNHVAYDMPSIDDMMRGAHRLKEQDIDIAWGPGRHTAGNNTFSYFVTPNGFAVEYTSELERVDEATWQAQVHTPSKLIMDQWGIGVGGPQTMPRAEPDPGLFKAVEV
jgi:catechol-2,3-dioxygenase